jgi:hypothetical protein
MAAVGILEIILGDLLSENGHKSLTDSGVRSQESGVRFKERGFKPGAVLLFQKPSASMRLL